MKHAQKKYQSPQKPWDKVTIEHDKNIKREFGLRRTKEIWRAQSILRNFRIQARELAANKDKAKEELLIKKVRELGLVSENASLDDVLALSLESLLNRRLETIIFKKGLAKTPKQARQFIVHGHIALDGRKIKWPSCLVKTEEENKIAFCERSAVKQSLLKQSEKKEGEVVGKTE